MAQHRAVVGLDTKAEPRVVVGLDFGTTFSGFAFAHQANLKDIHTFYEWPMQAKGGGKPYCKTQTSLYYVPNSATKDRSVVPKLSFGSQAGKASGLLAPVPPESDSRNATGSFHSEFVLKNWAWPAQVQYMEDVQAALKRWSEHPGDSGYVSKKRKQDVFAGAQELGQEVGYFVKTFKLHLASASDRPNFGELEVKKEQDEEQEDVSKLGQGLGAKSDLTRGKVKVKVEAGEEIQHGELPPGVTVERAIADYLHGIAGFIMAHLQNTYGKHLSKREVQWCLTVPAIWDDKAKQKMRYCAQRAGLVTGPSYPQEMAAAASPFPLIIVLESEAASVYCTSKSKELSLQIGAEFVVADVGGGTVDIVVHVKTKDEDDVTKIREVKASTGGLCGGSFVDKNFIHFLSRKIGCLQDYLNENPSAMASLLRKWEDLKCSFDGTLNSAVDFEVPTKLAKAWQMHEVMQAGAGRAKRESYDEIEITKQDIFDFFDPVVYQIFKEQMSPSIQVIMMLGGFSTSPYLMKRVREAFSQQVKEILRPPDPGSAICQGAVMLGASRDIITTRISRKTYGILQSRNFLHGHDPPYLLQVVDGIDYCKDTFQVYVKKGEEVNIDQCVEHIQCPMYSQQKSMKLSVYSTLNPEPLYITDPGVQLEGSFVINIPEEANTLDKHRKISVSLYFGRSCIQVKAKRVNFGNRTEVIEGLDNIEIMHSISIT